MHDWGLNKTCVPFHQNVLDGSIMHSVCVFLIFYISFLKFYLMKPSGTHFVCKICIFFENFLPKGCVGFLKIILER